MIDAVPHSSQLWRWAAVGTVAGVILVAGCAKTTGPEQPTWTSLYAGYHFTCGLRSTGGAYCWGDFIGASPDSTVHGYHLVPAATAVGFAFTSLTGGEAYMCGLTDDGAAVCWGRDWYGQLGDSVPIPNFVDRLKPVAVRGGLKFAALAAGGRHTCGLTQAGVAYCWGANDDGELGDSTRVSHSSPVAVAGGLTFATITAGFNHTCGITTGGAVFCWGLGDYGILGAASNLDVCGIIGQSYQCRTYPVPAGRSGVSIDFVRLTATYQHTCGWATSGTVYCWGNGQYGQLGVLFGSARWGDPVPGDVTYEDVSAGWLHTCGVSDLGAAYCWGTNASGQLGIGDRSGQSKYPPTAVAGGLTFVSVTAGAFHTCGLTTDGVAYCWGSGVNGELGDGSTAVRYAPVAVVAP